MLWLGAIYAVMSNYMYTVVERAFHIVCPRISSHLMVPLTNKTMVTELISYMDWIINSTLLDYLIHGLDYNTVYYNFILAYVMQHLPRGGCLDNNGLQNYHNVVSQYHVI